MSSRKLMPYQERAAGPRSVLRSQRRPVRTSECGASSHTADLAAAIASAALAGAARGRMTPAEAAIREASRERSAGAASAARDATGGAAAAAAALEAARVAPHALARERGSAASVARILTVKREVGLRPLRGARSERASLRGRRRE
jgi:hypothetical protein